MNLTYETIPQEKSQVLLKVKVDKEEIKKEYDTLLADVQKNAQIQGFRKGKAPRNVLEMKYKEGFLADTANHIIDKAYKEVADKVDKKPIAYAQPRLENFKLPELDTDWTFEIIYDVYPDFKITDNFKSIEAEKDEIKITDEDIDAEIENHLKKFATIEPKEGKIKDKDIVLVDYTAYLDDVEDYKKENEQIYIGTDYDMFKLSQDMIGLKKGDEKEIKKTFSDKEIEKIAGKTFKIKLKINEVKEEKFPELTDELVKQIDEKYATVKDLKDGIRDELEKYAESSAKNLSLSHVMKKIIETFEGDIPESMVAQQQDYLYHDMVHRFGGNEKNVEKFLKLSNQTVESYKKSIKESAVYEIKKGLIMQKIVKEQNITATDDEIKEKLKPLSERYKMGVDEVYKMYKDANQLDLFKNELEMQKALDYLFDTVKIKKGKKKSLKELFSQKDEDKE